jgi:5-methylthioadenosine/S-adenosylhomocysteine deaminase
MRMLIENGLVVTVDGDRRVFPSGSVCVKDGSISAVQGGRLEVGDRTDFDEVIDATGCIVMPGLINMHQHHWYTLFKGIADGLLLEDWLHQVVFPITPHLSTEVMRTSSYLCGMEMLATGTTCSLNHSVTVTTPQIVQAIIEPQAELGIRQVFAKELRCKTPLFPVHPLSLDEALAEFESEFKRWDNKSGGLIKFAMVIEANAHWTASGMSTEPLICRGYELAKKHKLRISSHISAGTFSLHQGLLKHLRETGRTDVRYLMTLGVLDNLWLLIHGIHCTDLDLDQAAMMGAALIYTPTSEAMRGGGIGPAAVAHEKGVLTALGTDGPMVDYSNDMVEQIKACSLLQHVRHLDPARMPVERAIEMATINAARALGLEKEIGSIEVGKRADLAIFDMRRPGIGIANRPLSTFFSAGSGADAKTVIVDGRIAFRDGKFRNGPDPVEVHREGEKQAASVLAKAGLTRRIEPLWRHPAVGRQ